MRHILSDNYVKSYCAKHYHQAATKQSSINLAKTPKYKALFSRLPQYKVVSLDEPQYGDTSMTKKVEPDITEARETEATGMEDESVGGDNYNEFTQHTSRHRTRDEPSEREIDRRRQEQSLFRRGINRAEERANERSRSEASRQEFGLHTTRQRSASRNVSESSNPSRRVIGRRVISQPMPNPFANDPEIDEDP